MNDVISIIIEYLPDFMQAMLETFYMVIVSMLVALIIGLPMGTLVYLTNPDSVIKKQWLNKLLNTYINLVRAVPFLLFVIFLMPVTRYIFGISLGAIPTPFPLSFIAIALFARLVEQALLEVPSGLIDTALSMGANLWHLIINFIFVEARSGIILAFTMTTISIISYSTVMGTVGGGGIGDFAMYYGYQRYEYTLMLEAIIVMIFMVLLIQFSGSYLAHKLNKK